MSSNTNEYFFLISNGSENYYKDNTRATFTNNLAKSFSIKSDQTIKLALDTVIFDNTFTTFISDYEIDVILFLKGQVFVLSLSNTKSLSSLVRKINRYFADISYSFSLNHFIGQASHANGKLTLRLTEGSVAISPSLCDFLQFDEELNIHQIQYGDILLDFLLLREHGYPPSEFTSKNEIRINDRTPEYIDIACDEIESYVGNSSANSSSMQKIISRIPLNTYQPTIFYSPTFRSFFHSTTNHINRIKISFHQPSGRILYFKDGSPNILKMALNTSKMNDFFYVQASSEKTPTFPGNNISSFQVELPKEFQLHGKWQVGVTNVFIPKPSNLIKFDTSVYVIPKGQNYFFVCYTNPIKRKKYIKFPLLEFSKHELVIFLLQEMSEFFLIHLDQNENIFLSLRKDDPNTQVQIFTSRALMEIINPQNILKTIAPIAITAIFKDRFKPEMVDFTREQMNNEMIEGVLLQKSFLRMTEKSAPDILYFDARTFYNINEIQNLEITKVDTKRILLLTENEFLKKEEIRLLQYIQNQQGVGSTHELIPSFFFIYCDFVKETVMANNYVNLLKMVPYRSGFNNLPGGLFDFPRCEFFDVTKNYIKNLNFELKTHSGRKYHYFPENENIIITMKFQKVS